MAEADLKNIQAVAASQLAFNTKCFENDRSRARQSFRAAVGFAAVGLLFFVAAIITAPIKGHLSAAIISAVGGSVLLTISGLNFWLYGRASAQLNLFHVRLEQTQRYLLANSMAMNLAEDDRNNAISDLIKTVISQQRKLLVGLDRRD